MERQERGKSERRDLSVDMLELLLRMSLVIPVVPTPLDPMQKRVGG